MSANTNVVPMKNEALRPTYRGPFAMFDELRTEFENLMQKPFWPAFTNRFREEKETWTPRIDVFEKDHDLVVRCDLPGMKKEDVHVTMEEGDLVLFGERKEETETQKESYYRAECNYGAFYRRLPLAFKVNPERSPPSSPTASSRCMSPCRSRRRTRRCPFRCSRQMRQ